MANQALLQTGIFATAFAVIYLLSCCSVVGDLMSLIGMITVAVPVGFTLRILLQRHCSHISMVQPTKVDARGKAVFITGCDTGFGHELAKRLFSKGFHVFAGCLFPDGAGAKLLENKGNSRLQVLQCDVTKNDEVLQCAADVAENVKQHNLQFWAVVSNAGIASFCEFEWLPVDQYEKTFDVNTMGSVRVIKAFLPLLRKSSGRIVIVASLAGRYAIPYFTGYSMSKHAQVALADGLRRELRKFDIKVSLIEPGMYKTNMANTEIGVRQVDKHWVDGSDEQKVHYGREYHTKFRANLEKFAEKCSPNIFEVVDAMEDAVASSAPEMRYIPGFNTALIRGHLMPILPYFIQDFLLGKLALKR